MRIKLLETNPQSKVNLKRIKFPKAKSPIKLLEARKSPKQSQLEANQTTRSDYIKLESIIGVQSQLLESKVNY